VKPWLLGLFVLGLPSPALACAACAAAVDRSNAAFLATTIFLSLLPLALMAGGLWWIARHARGRLVGEFEEREPPVGATAQSRTRDAAAPPLPDGTGTPLAVPGTIGEG
jgi:hypothetical protein